VRSSDVSKLVFHLLGSGGVEKGQKFGDDFRVFRAAFGDDDAVMLAPHLQKFAVLILEMDSIVGYDGAMLRNGVHFCSSSVRWSVPSSRAQTTSNPRVRRLPVMSTETSSSKYRGM